MLVAEGADLQTFPRIFMAKGTRVAQQKRAALACRAEVAQMPRLRVTLGGQWIEANGIIEPTIGQAVTSSDALSGALEYLIW